MNVSKLKELFELYKHNQVKSIGELQLIIHGNIDQLSQNVFVTNFLGCDMIIVVLNNAFLMYTQSKEDVNKVIVSMAISDVPTLLSSKNILSVINADKSCEISAMADLGETENDELKTSVFYWYFDVLAIRVINKLLPLGRSKVYQFVKTMNSGNYRDRETCRMVMKMLEDTI